MYEEAHASTGEGNGGAEGVMQVDIFDVKSNQSSRMPIFQFRLLSIIVDSDIYINRTTPHPSSQNDSPLQLVVCAQVVWRCHDDNSSLVPNVTVAHACNYCNKYYCRAHATTRRLVLVHRLHEPRPIAYHSFANVRCAVVYRHGCARTDRLCRPVERRGGRKVVAKRHSVEKLGF